MNLEIAKRQNTNLPETEHILLYKKLHVYGDHIDTDRMIAGKYTKTLDREILAKHAFEDLDPNFAQTVEQGDIVVGGVHFGCGSSREQAPIALKCAGVQLVIAKSFARIFFRNAINIGLPALELPGHTITKDSHLEIDLANGWVRDLSQGKVYESDPLPDFLQEIIRCGGLVAYLKSGRRFT